ncbi:hypothetical protein LVJ94_15460 [Pendulispora rubella]|uniref:Glycosyltransferase RgtA/B/C/D-like domain-containing protein n=1 Tax=Pendulispora rubella TaxID=2741070 RepID=A0ABZ2LCX6_9BACT
MRTVDNFVHGYGLTWNTFERVQGYTHPLWMLLVSCLYAIFGEGYFTTLALCFACSLGIVLVASRAWQADRTKLLAMVAIMVSSKSFVDYSTSGLENPLTHLLAAVFFFTLFVKTVTKAEVTERWLCQMVLLASFGYVNRADTVLLYGPSLAWLFVRAWKTLGVKSLRACAIGALPAVAWIAFSTIYYGFPLPNTAYAKLAGGHYHPPLFHSNGIAYFKNSLLWDPVTLPVVAVALLAGTFIALRRRRYDVLLGLVGVAALLVYAMRIGGDYMSGRLFALPYLMAVLVLVEMMPSKVRWSIAAAAFVIGLLGPRSPITGHWEPKLTERGETGILDDHSFHRPGNLNIVFSREDFDIGHGRRFEDVDPAQAMVWGAIGYHGFGRGPRLRTIDNLALTDALLARLPARDPEHSWGRGHLFRDVPEGYVTSVETGENRITDPALHAYYDKLLILTTGPIFTAERMKTIWEMNTGRYSHWIEEYQQHLASKN